MAKKKPKEKGPEKGMGWYKVKEDGGVHTLTSVRLVKDAKVFILKRHAAPDLFMPCDPPKPEKINKVESTLHESKDSFREEA